MVDIKKLRKSICRAALKPTLPRAKFFIRAGHQVVFCGAHVHIIPPLLLYTWSYGVLLGVIYFVLSRVVLFITFYYCLLC